MSVGDIEPICAACHPPRLADIDPTTATIHLCTEHQGDYDDHVVRTRLASLLQPRKPHALRFGDLGNRHA